jgi:Uma2 family endonuclease
MTSLTALPTLNLEPNRLKRLTVQDYHRMDELGILDTSERTELIAGQIVLKASKGTHHVLTLQLLAIALEQRLSQQPVFVITQDPIHLDDYSEPEPDLAIVRGTVLDYADRHPRPSDIHLLVEVADSTLKQDCEIKDKLYAQAGIPDYWVVDLKNRQLNIFRNPASTVYTSYLILTEPNQISPLAFPDVARSLTAILPPIATNESSS